MTNGNEQWRSIQVTVKILEIENLALAVNVIAGLECNECSNDLSRSLSDQINRLGPLPLNNPINDLAEDAWKAGWICDGDTVLCSECRDDEV